tara:strand:- start:153 stop:521 length:369 start_codon:yes stop_codon:yes gene_type:complete
MSLVRIPRLWTKRHYFHDWRSLNENKSFSDEEARELFKHEEMRWNLYEDELRNLYFQRQTKLVSQINQLDSYINNILTVSNPNTPGMTLDALKRSAIREIVTEEGVYFVLEDGNIIGPYLGA